MPRQPADEIKEEGRMFRKKGSLIFCLMVLLWGPSVAAPLLAQGEVSFIARRDFVVGGYPRSVTVGDFNGDAVQDLAVANQGSNNVSILLGNGDGTFGAARNFGVGSIPWSVTVGDFNGDALPDLAVANAGSNSVSILINDTPPR
jgi:hypothetical protein